MRITGRVIASMAVVATLTALGPAVVVRAAVGEPQSRPARASLPATATERQDVRRLSRTVDGVRFSLRVPTWGWERSPIARVPGGFRHGRLGISKSISGPQGAEAIVFWTSFPTGDRAVPCAKVLNRRIGRSAADLAAAVATAPGVELVGGPSPVTVGGQPAKHVVLSVRKDVGCDPGYFYSWRSECWGPCWVETDAGNTIMVWIVRVNGKRLFFEAETTGATPDLNREIRQIVESIRFG